MHSRDKIRPDYGRHMPALRPGPPAGYRRGMLHGFALGFLISFFAFLAVLAAATGLPPQ